MIRMIRLVPLLALVAACAAASIRTNVDVDPEADFSRFASFAWIPTQEVDAALESHHGGYVSGVDRQLIVDAVEEVLTGKGYRRAASLDAADLALGFAVGREQKTEVRSVPGSRTYTFEPGFSRRGYGHGGGTMETLTFEQGTLVIEFYAAATKRLVWIGSGSKRLSKSDEPEELVRLAVDTILASFPARNS